MRSIMYAGMKMQPHELAVLDASRAAHEEALPSVEMVQMFREDCLRSDEWRKEQEARLG